MLKSGMRIHFVGIGGVGMSGLAKVLLEKGMIISGSDAALNRYTEELKSMGAKIFKGHRASHVKDADIIVYSSSIRPDNIELREAKRLNLRVLKRLALFQEFTKDYRSIMVTGTHGKTTTTGIISHVLLNAGFNPTILIGGDLAPFGNAHLGGGRYLVAELDESDGEFVNITPSFLIVTNIENDHLDNFGSLPALFSAFERFIKSLRSEKMIFFSEDIILKKITSEINRKRFSTYGFDSGCDYYAGDAVIGPCSSFNFFEKGSLLGKLLLSIPGKHNVLNAIAATGILLSLGIEFRKIQDILPGFRGVSRRFELKGDVSGIKVVEDYAHHPTEIKAVLSSAQLYKPRRTLVIFQPHRYSRTESLMDEFSLSFSDADVLAITEIYNANEKNKSGVSSRDLVKLIRKRTHKKALFFETPEDAADYMIQEAKKSDMILILGAGDVNRITKKVVEGLRAKY